MFKVKLSDGKDYRLDFKTTPLSFQAWQERAIGVLSGDRLDVRKLLDWAAQCNTPIDAVAAEESARSVGLYYEDKVTDINIKLLDGIQGMIDDSLMSRSGNCGEGYGLELWRSLQAEWKGTGNQVLFARYRAFSTTIDQLWESLYRYGNNT